MATKQGWRGWVARVTGKRGADRWEKFPGSQSYWESRYARGGNSGAGSYGKFAEFKARFLNDFVDRLKIGSVIEFGCGDGNQLSLAAYPSYLGLDISETAVNWCRERFAGRPHLRFMLMRDYQGETAELALSLDVVYHLVEDEVFENYMRTLFRSATRHVILYSSDREDERPDPHVRHRKFTEWVQANIAGWRLFERVDNIYPFSGDYQEGSFADFFIYGKDPDPALESAGLTK